MATKNYAQMSTKKLNALMATATEEEQAKIQEVLNARVQAQSTTPAEPTVVEIPAEEELSAEEAAAIEAAEKNNGANPMSNSSKSTVTKAVKMTDEELEALAEQLKANVGHKCEVVPYNTIEWAKGYIISLTVEKRSRKILYNIRLEDGRRMVKVYDSNLLKISDEVITEAEKPVKVRVAKEKIELSDEQIEAIAAEARKQIGKTVKFKAFGKNEEIEGRIMSLSIDRRGPQFLYKIKVVMLNDNGEEISKFMHKSYNSPDLVIAEEFDEEGQTIYNKSIGIKVDGNASEKLAKLKESLTKAEAKVAALKEQIAKLEAQMPAEPVTEAATETTDELA